MLVELDIEDNKDDDDFLQVGETEKTDKKEKKKAYKKTSDRGESQWMQQFMQNNNYKIENVAGDGSCFFCNLLEMLLKV